MYRCVRASHSCVARVGRSLKESEKALDGSLPWCGPAIRFGKISHPFFGELLLTFDNGQRRDANFQNQPVHTFSIQGPEDDLSALYPPNPCRGAAMRFFAALPAALSEQTIVGGGSSMATPAPGRHSFPSLPFTKVGQGLEVKTFPFAMVVTENGVNQPLMNPPEGQRKCLLTQR